MRRYTVLLICFLFLISSVVFAQRSAKKRDYVKLGTAHFAKGDIDSAQKDFEKGYQLRGQPKVLLQMHALEIKNLIDEVKQRHSTFRDKIA